MRAKEQKGIDYYMSLPYSILLHEVKEDGEKYWIAEVTELPGCKSHGSSVEEAVKSVEEAKKDWILDSLKSGEEVPVPVERDRYSGRILVRMSRSLHHSLALIAEAEKLSLNQLIVTLLAKEVGRLNVLNRVEYKVDTLLQKIDRVLEEELNSKKMKDLLSSTQLKSIRDES
jgi:antitoxin HicB